MADSKEFLVILIFKTNTQNTQDFWLFFESEPLTIGSCDQIQTYRIQRWIPTRLTHKSWLPPGCNRDRGRDGGEWSWRGSQATTQINIGAELLDEGSHYLLVVLCTRQTKQGVTVFQKFVDIQVGRLERHQMDAQLLAPVGTPQQVIILFTACQILVQWQPGQVNGHGLLFLLFGLTAFWSCVRCLWFWCRLIVGHFITSCSTLLRVYCAFSLASS